MKVLRRMLFLIVVLHSSAAHAGAVARPLPVEHPRAIQPVAIALAKIIPKGVPLMMLLLSATVGAKIYQKKKDPSRFQNPGRTKDYQEMLKMLTASSVALYVFFKFNGHRFETSLIRYRSGHQYDLWQNDIQLWMPVLGALSKHDYFLTLQASAAACAFMLTDLALSSSLFI